MANPDIIPGRFQDPDPAAKIPEPPEDALPFRPPARYGGTDDFLFPDLTWMLRTWHVTHSTLSMWRDARNVRITYASLPAERDGRLRIDDKVEYQPKRGGAKVKTKTIAGIDTEAGLNVGSWSWRGKGWLFFVQSHWELLGWGESPGAGAADGSPPVRWVVTWFQKTLFTKEGVDIYCESPKGVSRETLVRIMDALRLLHPNIARMVDEDMREVEITLD